MFRYYRYRFLILNAVVAFVWGSEEQSFMNHPSEWRVLGPFPIHAREQHFLSPSFPLNLTESIVLSKTWPSSYADGGSVSWHQIYADHTANNVIELRVSFPDIRWSTVRATEGWAALQHHSILRTTLTLYPPRVPLPDAPHLLVDLKRGSFFAVTQYTDELGAPETALEWHSGNIYDMERTVPATVELPIPPSGAEPTRYNLFISGDYEIRLFGDPRTQGTEIPVLSIVLVINVEHPKKYVVREPTHDVICDFVDGFSFGDAIGIGIRATSGWWTLSRVELADSTVEDVNVELARPIRIAPTQTQILPIRLTQLKPFFRNELKLDLTLLSDEAESIVFSVALPVRQVPQWATSGDIAIRASYFYAESTPTYYLVIPPRLVNCGTSRPPILALHGAGVDIAQHTFWADAIPRQNHSWIILPTGRTSWGMDWHGPSAEDAWECLDALTTTLQGNRKWHPLKLANNTPVVVMGHSNGGQGSWYLGSRYPDRVMAVIAVAAYIKSQAYVPLTMSRTRHFIDPDLWAVLESALTPDDNDLFLSNLVDTPVLAIHGGCDENVPTWHSREAISVLRYWQPSGDITLQEDALKPHWYPSVLNNAHVQAFLDRVLDSPSWPRPKSSSFTLTVAAVAETGSFHGWRIESLIVPGRLGRLRIADRDGLCYVTTHNVHSFSTPRNIVQDLVVDGKVLKSSEHDSGVRFTLTESGSWAPAKLNNATHSSGRVQAILTSTTSIQIIIPQRGPSRERSAALRLAHTLNVYHNLDVDIVDSAEALKDIRDGTFTPGNVIAIGDTKVPFIRHLLAERRTPFQIDDNSLSVNGRPLTHAGLGILFMHPHPTVDVASMLFIMATDAFGLERAMRLFPFRTGVTVPDWIVVGDAADSIGAAGVVGAGVWHRNWGWNHQKSWLY